ncbi:MAG: heavy metal efflux pump [Elusimicrobia bacterium]|nr:MAG: heavy metal efflux pump [Elusimicrobiota bacterium]
MIRFFLERRVLTNLITFFVIGIGGWQSLKVRREAFPDIKFDIVTVSTAYPGGSPEEVETLVTRRVEEQLKGISGIDRAESFSLENQSLVVLRLDEDLSDREKDKVVNELYQAAARVEDLPDLADKPLVKEMTSRRPLISPTRTATVWPRSSTTSSRTSTGWRASTRKATGRGRSWSRSTAGSSTPRA